MVIRLGEYLVEWRKEIRAMRQAVEIWELVKADDAPSLRRFFRWGPYTPRTRKPRSMMVNVTETRDPWRPSAAAVTPGTVCWLCGDGTPALTPPHVALTCDDILAAARFHIHGLASRRLFAGARVGVDWRPSEKRSSLSIRPDNLLSAMWLQYTRAVTGEVEYLRCKVCSGWMVVGSVGDGVRADREFCSGACKQRDHRNRVREANRLKARGRNVRQIAAELNTTVEIVKNWLTKGK
jgi:hypothetical protein